MRSGYVGNSQLQRLSGGQQELKKEENFKGVVNYCSGRRCAKYTKLGQRFVITLKFQFNWTADTNPVFPPQLRRVRLLYFKTQNNFLREGFSSKHIFQKKGRSHVMIGKKSKVLPLLNFLNAPSINRIYSSFSQTVCRTIFELFNTK